MTEKFVVAELPPPGAGLLTTMASEAGVLKLVLVSGMVSDVALTMVAVTEAPAKVTLVEALKPVPVTVTVFAVAPATSVEGEIEVTVGTGFVTDKLTALDDPPPGEGLVTTTARVAADARFAVVSGMVSDVELAMAGVTDVPPRVTAVIDENPVPVTVSVVAAEPTGMMEGEMDVTVGAALLTDKLTALDDPPPGEGLVTTTASVPADARLAAVSGMVREVALTMVGMTDAPARVTVVTEENPVPVTVSVVAAEPARIVEGEIDEIVGARFVTVRLTELEAPPPGAELVTTTGKVPAIATSEAVKATVKLVELV